jgi:hypothetical protein
MNAHSFSKGARACQAKTFSFRIRNENVLFKRYLFVYSMKKADPFHGRAAAVGQDIRSEYGFSYKWRFGL